ncbi:MAG: hypothetical protein CVU00_11125 [Bacteroidetes bacterium HGW-Bacteroidetes-17]|jgi:tetratricopeptide (TPR) repeat protein|nr:MAG: hypothetical protein CVU00_11125 [Bacteroidetes bacterium HGW-Bacteroidetes-17]
MIKKHLVMRKCLMVLACFLIGLINESPLQAQTEAFDSLNRDLYQTMDVDQRIKIINQMAYELRLQDPQKSFELSDEALTLAREKNSKEDIAHALNTKGYFLYNNFEYTQALNCYLEAIKLYNELEKEEDIAMLHYRIGSIYKTIGNYEKATESCLAGLKAFEALDDKAGIALIYRVMGSIYKYKGEYEKSLFYYFNGLKINEELENTSSIAASYNNIGIVYARMKDNELALKHYQKSLAINLSLKLDSEVATNYGNIGKIYLDMNQLDSAFIYNEKRYETALLLNDKKGIAIAMQAYGDFYFKKRDYPLAIEYYEKALLLSKNIGILETVKNVLKSLSDLYEENFDYQKAISFHKSYDRIRDSILNNETLQRIEQMEMEYVFEKERNALLLLEQKRKLYRSVGFAILLFSILLLILIYKNQRIRLKRKDLEQKNLELDKKQLQSEVDFKNKELVSKAIHLAEKNELINDISNRLRKVIVDPTESAKELKETVKDLRFHSDTHLWEEFEFTFLQVHPDYFNSLGRQFPDLTSNEKRLSAFLRLNLSTKEISNITHQSLHSLTVARTRLRKKLGIANTSENLASFLNKF